MAPWGLIARAFLAMEDVFVQRLLSSPQFHHVVRRIHRKVEDVRHGRDPNEPLRPGEATEEPLKRGLASLFIDELRNQVRGTLNEPPRPSKAPSPPKR